MTINFLSHKASTVVLLVLGLLTLGLVSNAYASTTIKERVDFSRAMPEENVEDMRVKVLGGSISIERFYRVMKRVPSESGYPGVSGDLRGYNGNTLRSQRSIIASSIPGLANRRYDFGLWQFHRRWHDLLFVDTDGLLSGAGFSSGGSSSSSGSTTVSAPSGEIDFGSNEPSNPKRIDRNDYIYELVDDEDYYVYEHNGNDLRITITDTGFTWSNRDGDWIEYDEDGLAIRSGDKNGVSINLVRNDDDLITEYKDHLGNTVVTWQYDDNKPVKVTDYGGRTVEYKWDGDDLIEVTTTRGHKWTYGYTDYGSNRFMTTKTDPENQVFTYEFQETTGGFQSGGGGSVGADISVVGDAAPVSFRQSSGGSGGSLTVGLSVPAEPTWVMTAKVYPDGKRMRYQYRYDPESNAYMVLQVNSDGVERERWFDLDGQTRYHLIGGRVASVRIRNGSSALSRDSYGNRTIVNYTRFEAVESVSFADGGNVSYEYLPNYNFPTLETDQLGVETKHEYDNKGNRIKTIYAFNTDEQRTTEYDYDVYGQLTAARIIGDDTTPTTEVEYKYDNRGNVTEYTDGRGNKTQFNDYNSNGQYQTMVDARGKSWAMTYDAFGNEISETSALGFTSTYEYDTLHRLAVFTDPENRKREFAYDSRNNVIESTNNVDDKVLLSRRMDGQVNMTQDEIGRTVNYRYDRVGRLTEVTDAVGNQTSVRYLKEDEVAGTRISQIEGPNYSTHLAYDPVFRLIEQTQLSVKEDGLETTTAIAYSTRGERLSVTDANGNTSRWTYNAHAEMLTATNAENEVATNSYDPRGNVRSVTDALGSVYRFEYDLNSNVAREYRPMGEVKTHGYDANNNQTSLTDYAGNSAVYGYDDDNRLIRQENTKFGEPNTERIVEYTFDKSNLPKSVVDANSSVEYKYDELGRLDEQTRVFNTGGLPIVKTLKKSYYKNSELESRTDAEGIVSFFTYDAAGKFKQLNIQSAGAINVSAYEGELVKSMTFPGGLNREYQYDGLSRLSNILVTDNAGNTKMDYGYGYDKVGNITDRTTQQGNYQYAYDRAYRLTNAEQPSIFGNQTYSYDDNSNRTELVNLEGTTSYAYNDNQELTSTQKTLGDVNTARTLSYDANGLQRSESTDDGDSTNYTYNAYRRLNKVDNNEVELATYEYDPQGRRLSKTLNDETIYFLYDDTGSGLVGEYDANGNLIRGYSYNINGVYTTDPVTQKTSNSEGGFEFDFYQNDHLGSPQQMIASNGTVTWQGEYDAFGKTHLLIADKVNPLRFPGQYFDSETGNHQNWNRYYNPGSGRYVTSDPIGLNGGLNTYGYVSGNPLVRFDYYGLDEFVMSVSPPKSSAINDNGAHNPSKDPGHVQAELRDSDGKTTHFFSMGPGISITKHNVSDFTGEGVPGTSSYQSTRTFNEYILGDLTDDKLKICQNAFNDVIANPGNYTPDNQCTSSAINLAKQCGLDVPDGVGPVETPSVIGLPGVPGLTEGIPRVPAYSGSHPNPHVLNKQLKKK